jgi:RNA polymerase sigma-70 factor (ECF subfamily)
MRADLSSPENFEALVREHQAMVFRTLTRMTGTGVQVEDLAQEVFLRLYRALPHFRGDATISTYLYRIVVNVAQDEWKRRRKEREHLAPEPVFDDEGETGAAWIENFAGDELAGGHARSPEQLLSEAQTQGIVDAALMELPEVERSVLVLYHQEECSYEGISVALGLPINTVRTHLHRGRKRLSGLVQARLGVQPVAKSESVAVAARPQSVKNGDSSQVRVVMAGRR